MFLAREIGMLIASALLLVMLAVLHSWLGEISVLKPLFASSWNIGIPEGAARRLVRFCWHLPSLAWLGLAALVLGAPALQCAAGVSLATALLIFFSLRGHFAWPVFVLSALFAWEGGNCWPGGLVLPWVALVLGLVIGLSTAALHGYWALGGRWGLHAALPHRKDGEPAFRPGFGLCALMGMILFFWTTLIAAPLIGVSIPAQRWLLWASVAILTLRLAGEGRKVGFFKQDRNSLFARWDDALYLPLVFSMLLAALACLKLT